MSERNVPVCTAGGSTLYGTQQEADACRIKKGQRVLVTRRNGDLIHGTLKLLWFFDSPMYEVAHDGGAVGTYSFELGDAITAEAEGGAG